MNRAFWELLWAIALCLVGGGIALAYSRWAGLVDIPNYRSSHSVPTPRGGGIALVASVLAVAGYELFQRQPPHHLAFESLGFVLILLTVVGWFDDHRSISVGLRLPLHLACGVGVAGLVNAVAPLPGPMNIAWLAWWVVWSVASINIVNFMDGIDGMVASQGTVYGLFLFALIPGSLFGSRYGLILAGSCLGFLVWNWAPARMFMGDVGSGPLGLLLVIGGALALEGASAVLVFLPLFPLFFDALATLVIRIRAGERVTQAHRSHLYQRAANSGLGHATVSTSYALAAGVGGVIALLAKADSPVRVGFAVVVYCGIVVGMWLVAHARFPRAPASPALE
jgi:UDP-N-acetylmuramyl pentapeptide phosphotransferase/UDP-N-acetylglucosamine-1-phosphate transferase